MPKMFLQNALQLLALRKKVWKREETIKNMKGEERTLRTLYRRLKARKMRYERMFSYLLWSL